MNNLLFEPWPWYTSGLLIALIMLLLILWGKTFGFSSNFRTVCAACGLGSRIPFFNFEWKSTSWNLLFALGALIGGYLATHFLGGNKPPQLSAGALADLDRLGLLAPQSFQPEEIFNFKYLFTLRGFFVLVVGGFLVGFGTRWAGGCTSGHAISGLSNLQWPSLLAVIGFFAGGLVTTWFIWPLLGF